MFFKNGMSTSMLVAPMSRWWFSLIKQQLCQKNKSLTANSAVHSFKTTVHASGSGFANAPTTFVDSEFILTASNQSAYFPQLALFCRP